MWRDPLDELIEDLEQVTGPEAIPQIPSMGEFVIYMDTLMNGSVRSVKRLRHDPGYRRFLQSMFVQADVTLPFYDVIRTILVSAGTVERPVRPPTVTIERQYVPSLAVSVGSGWQRGRPVIAQRYEATL